MPQAQNGRVRAPDVPRVEAVGPSIFLMCPLTHVTTPERADDLRGTDWRQPVRRSGEDWKRPVGQPAAPVCRPNGVWLSVAYDWERRCHDTSFYGDGGLARLAVLDVRLRPNTVLMLMNTPRQAADFRRLACPGGPRAGAIDWRPVAEQYHGICFLNSGNLGAVDSLWRPWRAHCICMFDPSRIEITGRRTGADVLDLLALRESLGGGRDNPRRPED